MQREFQHLHKQAESAGQACTAHRRHNCATHTPANPAAEPDDQPRGQRLREVKRCVVRVCCRTWDASAKVAAGPDASILSHVLAKALARPIAQTDPTRISHGRDAVPGDAPEP